MTNRYYLNANEAMADLEDCISLKLYYITTYKQKHQIIINSEEIEKIVNYIKALNTHIKATTRRK